MKFTQIRSALSIVDFANVRFLIDPMLSAKFTMPAVPMTLNCAPGNPTTDLPANFSTVKSLANVDAVIVTHLHFDHFDDAAKKLLPKTVPVFAQSENDAREIAAAGFTDVRVLEKNGSDFKTVRLFKTDCEHGKSDLVMCAGYEKVGFSAEASGVVFAANVPGLERQSFYLAGDTVFSSAVINAIEKYRPGIIAVNAAGAEFPRGHLLIMNEYDVLTLMRRYPELDVIATHLDGVSHATVSSDELRAFAATNGLARLRIPAAGETISL